MSTKFLSLLIALLSIIPLAAGGKKNINMPASTQEVGQVSIKKWADDRKSAFTLTFDDGFSSCYDYVRPVLNSFGFKGTFFLITNSLTDDLPGIWRYGTWNQFRTMALDGHEMGAHTVTHSDLTTLPVGDISTPGTLKYELFQSQATIDKEITTQKCITLAYPYTTYNNTVIDNTQAFYASARAGGKLPNDITLNPSDLFKIQAKEEDFNLPRNSTADDLDELNDMENYLSNSISSGTWGAIMTHEVYPFAQIANILQQGSWYPTTTEWLTALCQFLKSKSDSRDVWVETMGNITKYIKERDDFTATLLSSTNTQIKLTGSDGLDIQRYNYPLTADISVPVDWQKVIVNQGTRTDTLLTFISGGVTLVRTNFVPDGSTLTINKQIELNNFSISGTVSYDNTSESKIQNVNVTLTGTNNYQLSGITDINGSFNFTGLTPGTYTISVSKLDGWNEVNSTDALLILRNYAGLAPFDSLQTLAGDVNNDNLLNSTDALLIIKRYAGLINSFPKPDWVFSPVTITVNSNQNTVLNIKAMVTGDVNKSFVF
jgi:peptidoglycan/xylan/chitin deacetylase (PgdA/CDA1 family)